MPAAKNLNQLIGSNVTIHVTGVRPAGEEWRVTVLDIDRASAGEPVLVARIVDSTDGTVHLFPWHAIQRIVVHDVAGG